MVRVKRKLFLMVFILWLAGIPCLSQQGPGKGKRVSVDGDILSVDIESVALFDILKEIAAETGMEVTIDPEVDKNVTASFQNVPIDRGIARLTHPLDYVIKWKRKAAHLG